jgi:hypothetical protein
MTDPPAERREFFRVRDRLYIEFRQVDPEESLVLEKNLQESNAMSDALRNVGLSSSNTAAFRKDDIYAYLEMVDRKLNMVIDLLSGKDQLFHGLYVDVVVSGSGLKYVSDRKLDAGVLVEFRLALPFFPKSRIAALGKVVRCEKRDVKGNDAWETSVSFVAINEKDRDVLIRYVFSKERKASGREHASWADKR